MHTRDAAGWIVEADVQPFLVHTGDSSAYTPCDRHRDGGCGNSGSGKSEIANLIAHEMGHVVGLGDLSGPEPVELTMHSQSSTRLGERSKVTLGYGDKLGLSKLYPCGCPLTPIYEP